MPRQIEAENARQIELPREFDAATTERDNGAHRRAIEAIEFAQRTRVLRHGYIAHRFPCARRLGVIESQSGLWHSPSVGLKLPARLMVLGVVCAASGCGEEVFSGVQVIRVTPSQEVSLQGARCETFMSDGSGGGSVAAPTPASPTLGGGRPDFWFQEETSDDGITFTFGSGAVTLDSKLYRNLFFETRKLDRVSFKSVQGDHYVVSVWGSHECDSCPPDSRIAAANGADVCGAAEALELTAAAGDE